MANQYAVLWLLAGLLAMSTLFLAEEEDSAQALRCEMFQMWADSNGQYGWPEESNPAAAKQCNQSEATSK